MEVRATGRKEKQNRKLSESSLTRIGEACFYAGLLLEVLILILDKSSWINPYEGQLFRVSFLFFALKLCLTKYSLWEWGAILAAGILAGICYLCSTRDEAVRVVVFVASMKGINHRQAMKTVFWTTIAGLAVLAGLAFAGVLGEVFEASQGFGFKEGRWRLCFGVGNSNAFATMVWALMTLGIYLYHEKMKLWHYGLLLVLSGLVYYATVTRTALLVMAATILLAMVLQYVPRLQQAAWVYGGGIAAVLFGVGFSVFAAQVSDWPPFMPEWVQKIDRMLTGRIASIYAFENGGGVPENWRLFGDPDYIEYFDMGYVRLVFWYGIIPAVCCILVLCLLMWECRRQRDYMAFVLVLSFAVYTVIEAHAVSVYIARNYVLMLLGAYWTNMLVWRKKDGGEKQAYWWRFWELLKNK